MTNPFIQSEVSAESSFPQFNALESAAPAALKEMPMYLPETQIVNTNALASFDADQNQPFEITDGNTVVASSCPGGCNCSEYRVSGWNRNARSQNMISSSCDDGSCDDGEDYNPSSDYDDGGCDDGSCDGGGGGLLRGLLSRFGRGGLMGLFGGGGLGFARAFRR